MKQVGQKVVEVEKQKNKKYYAQIGQFSQPILLHYPQNAVDRKAHENLPKPNQRVLHDACLATLTGTKNLSFPSSALFFGTDDT